MKGFSVLVIVCSLLIGLYGFRAHLDSARTRAHCEGIYAEWLRLTPDKTAISSRRDFTALPDSLVRECESSIVGGHAIFEQYSEMYFLVKLSTVLLLAVGVMGVVTAKSRR